MTTPISPNNTSNSQAAHLANRLEGLRVTDGPENTVTPAQSSVAVAYQDFAEAMKMECESFTRDICSQLADVRQDLREAIKGEGGIISTFASLRESMDKDHAKLMEQLNVLKEKLDRMG